MYEVIIVGGGPAGLSAALLLGRACRQVVIVDGGHSRNAPARELHGFLGRDGTPPRNLIRDGREEVAKYGVEFIADQVIRSQNTPRTDAQPFATAFSIETKTGRQLSGRKLLFATGMHDELRTVPGVRECFGDTVHICPYCYGWEHGDERIVIYADQLKDAIALGLAVKVWTEDVTILTNGRSVEKDEVERLAKAGIRYSAEKIVRFLCQGNQLTGVEFDGPGVLAAEALFFHPNQRASCDLPRSLGAMRWSPKRTHYPQAKDKYWRSIPGRRCGCRRAVCHYGRRRRRRRCRGN